MLQSSHISNHQSQLISTHLSPRYLIKQMGTSTFNQHSIRPGVRWGVLSLLANIEHFLCWCPGEGLVNECANSALKTRECYSIVIADKVQSTLPSKMSNTISNIPHDRNAGDTDWVSRLLQYHAVFDSGYAKDLDQFRGRPLPDIFSGLWTCSVRMPYSSNRRSGWQSWPLS